MKYESKFGIGEIVTTHQKEHDGRIIPDLIGEVIAVTFDSTAIAVHVRLSGGSVQLFREAELIGDSDFDQERGGY